MQDVPAISFFPGTCVIRRPIKLIGKGVVFQWTSAGEAAFETLRTAMVSSPVFSMPAHEEMYHVRARHGC